MAPGISKGQVVGVVSLAKQIQDIQDIRGLESVVSQHFPAELPKETEISDEVMYELGETLRINPKYMRQAMQLYSDSLDDLFPTLEKIGAIPCEELRKEWIEKRKNKHRELVLSFLNTTTNPRFPFINLGSEKAIFNYIIGHAEKTKTRIFGVRISFDENYISGKVEFNDSFEQNGKVSANVNLQAFTKNILTLFSGPIRDLTLQIPGISSCSVSYAPYDKIYYSHTKDPY